MGAVNAIPLYSSWKAYQLDGVEIAGWPFTCFENWGGGYSHILPQMLFANLVIAISIAYFVAKALKMGWSELFHKLRAWDRDDTP